MRKIIFISVLLCLAMGASAQYIGSQYWNISGGLVIDENQPHGSIGTGKVFKGYKLGAVLGYRNLNNDQVKANTVTVGPEFAYYLLHGSRFSLSGLVAASIGFQRAGEKTELVRLKRHRAFVYGYEVGIRPELLITPKFALTAEYRFNMLFNSVVRNNNYVGLGCIFYL